MHDAIFASIHKRNFRHITGKFAQFPLRGNAGLALLAIGMLVPAADWVKCPGKEGGYAHSTALCKDALFPI